jgi:hypothetical protein
MSSPAPDAEPTPALLAPNTPRAIRDALIGTERAEFEERYADEMAQAARTLDLTGVIRVLNIYRKIADITQRNGVEAHRIMLDRVARLRQGENVPTVPGHVHHAEINARLAR